MTGPTTPPTTARPQPPIVPPPVRPPVVPSPPIAPPQVPPPTVSAPLPCTLARRCSVVYGTVGSHFDQFGPQATCRPGFVRCVVTAPTTQRPTTQRPVTPITRPPTTPTRPLPCVASTQCAEVYGAEGFHFDRYFIVYIMVALHAFR